MDCFSLSTFKSRRFYKGVLDTFRNPHTRKGAILTGCKNISDIERLEDGYVWATDWDMEFYLPGLSPEITAVGIRRNTIRTGPGDNAVRCRVLEVNERPFSYTVMLESVLAPASVPLGWKLPKQDWEAIKSDTITIHVPREAILLLRD